MVFVYLLNLLQFSEKYGSNGNAVHRFKIVSHIYRKGTQFAQYLQLEQEGDARPSGQKNSDVQNYQG